MRAIELIEAHMNAKNPTPELLPPSGPIDLAVEVLDDDDFLSISSPPKKPRTEIPEPVAQKSRAEVALEKWEALPMVNATFLPQKSGQYDVMKYWREIVAKYPELKPVFVVACTFFCAHATAAGCERIFKCASLLQDGRRNGIGVKMLETRVFLKMNPKYNPSSEEVVALYMDVHSRKKKTAPTFDEEEGQEPGAGAVGQGGDDEDDDDDDDDELPMPQGPLTLHPEVADLLEFDGIFEKDNCDSDSADDEETASSALQASAASGAGRALLTGRYSDDEEN
jgi:hypothetical protein